MEGCSTCASYDHGCCEDGLTPALGPDQEVGRCCIIVHSHVLVPCYQGCGCESSVYGCCLDGETAATGENFLGCSAVPGASCAAAPVTGPCTNYTDKWFYDVEYGE